MEGETIGLKKGEAIGLKKGEAIGLKKGEAIGLKKGEAIGLEKGKEEGRTEERKDMISTMLANGASEQQICQLLNITPEIFKSLTENL